MAVYSNLPVSNTQQESTLQAFSTYYNRPLEINSGVLAAITGFFSNKGFEKVSAESIAVIIIGQARAENTNPMEVLDTLKGLNEIELSGVVAELLNANRVKTSYLGYNMQFGVNQEVKRNILA